MHWALTEYVKQGLHAPHTLPPERLQQYIEALRPTGVVLQFACATDWTTWQRSKPRQ